MPATMSEDTSCAHRGMWNGRKGYGVGFTRFLRVVMAGRDGSAAPARKRRQGVSGGPIQVTKVVVVGGCRVAMGGQRRANRQWTDCRELVGVQLVGRFLKPWIPRPKSSRGSQPTSCGDIVGFDGQICVWYMRSWEILLANILACEMRYETLIAGTDYG